MYISTSLSGTCLSVTQGYSTLGPDGAHPERFRSLRPAFSAGWAPAWLCDLPAWPPLVNQGSQQGPLPGLF